MLERGLVPVTPGHVVLLEDDREVAETLTALLQHDGHRVLWVQTVPEADRAIADDPPDVVVSDIYLPGLTGLDLLERLRADGKDLEFILMSGEPSLDTAREAVRHGAFDYLVKPVSGRALRRAVADALTRHRARTAAHLQASLRDERSAALERAVTERSRELEESQERYRQLVESLPLLAYEMDGATRRLTYVGGQLSSLVGGRRRDWEQRLHPDDRERVMAAMAVAMERRVAAAMGDFRLVAPDGATRWVRNVSAPVAPGASVRLSGFLVDVTEQHAAEAERARLERELSEARIALDRALLEELDLGAARAVRVADAVAPVEADELGQSEVMRRVTHDARLCADHPEPVLITGETGTGKGVLAEWIHAHGPRAKGPFVALNCSCLRGELLESELFGHSRGAFTSAVKERRGLIEEAHGGTLFLDEIGEMSLETQAKVLKVLEDKTFRRLGESSTRRSDFRLVAATNRHLAEEVARGGFRQDLYFRINVFTLRLPPLRERGDDVVVLAMRLLRDVKAPQSSLPVATQALLREHTWPGNVRELRNSLIRATLMARGGPILPEHFSDLAPSTPRPPAADSSPTHDDGAEAEQIRELIQRFDGNLAKVARTLGLSRAALYRRLHRHGLVPRRE